MNRSIERAENRVAYFSYYHLPTGADYRLMISRRWSKEEGNRCCWSQCEINEFIVENQLSSWSWTWICVFFGWINLNKLQKTSGRMCVEGERQTTFPCGFVHVWNHSCLFFRLECCASSSYLSFNLFPIVAFIFQGLVTSSHTASLFPSLSNRFWHLQLLIFHFLCNRSMRLLTRDAIYIVTASLDITMFIFRRCRVCFNLKSFFIKVKMRKRRKKRYKCLSVSINIREFFAA